MQMRCVNILLKAGAAMTERQATIITQTLTALDDPKVVLLSISMPLFTWLPYIVGNHAYSRHSSDN